MWVKIFIEILTTHMGVMVWVLLSFGMLVTATNLVFIILLQMDGKFNVHNKGGYVQYAYILKQKVTSPVLT